MPLYPGGMVEGRSAVVTGAGRGIGRQCAELLAAEGAKVVVNDLDPEPAGEVVEAIQAAGGEAMAVCGSVTDPDFTDELAKTAAETFGGGSLDILVNNAGITRDKVVHKMRDEDWEFVIDVNLRGTFNCIRSAALWMREVAKAEIAELGDVRYHRKIVNFYSTAAIRGNPGQINYTAAKMGNVGITRTIAQEWGRFKINVNAVAPGFTDTRLTKPKEEMAAQGFANMGIPKAQRDATISRIPFGRPGKPEEIAGAVLFFCSPLADYVTGQEINVSGGMQVP